MKPIELKQHDTEPLDVTLARGGRPRALDPADTVLFMLRLRDETEPVVEGECIILDAPKAKVRYPFVEGDLATAGLYDAEWQVTYSDGSIGTWPKRGYQTVVVYPDIGPSIS